MIDRFLRDRDEPAGNAPHWSASRINRYLTCPRQYQLYYLEKLRPKVPPANLAFGQVVHHALAGLFLKKEDPVKGFQDSWGMIKDIPIAYKERESWDKLRACGEGLLTKFVAEELPKLGQVEAVEHPFTLAITNLDLPFVGIIDLVAAVEGRQTVVDFKTAAGAYDDHEAVMSDQLTAYNLAKLDIDQLALCVLVKTKEPQIVWHFTCRKGEELAEYLAKVGYVAHDITDCRFYKRSGLWCAWCDFLPVCVGNRKKADETLVTVA